MSTGAYAQTNLQLFHQLSRDDFSDRDLLLVFKAYDLAMRLFTGYFRPSGKTFIAHLVGTASILGSVSRSSELVAAGLLHAAYDEGDFGSSRKGITPAKRRQVRHTIGVESEECIFRYAALPWNLETIAALSDRLDALDPIDRAVVLMRLANELEDHLDLGILYCPNVEARRRTAERRGPLLVALADRLGLPALSRELEEAFSATASGRIPSALNDAARPSRAYLIAPDSYRKKLSAALCQKVRAGARRLRLGYQP